MENRTYKKPPLNEMYAGIHFQTDPPISQLDFQQFNLKMKTHFKESRYIFPIIEHIGNINRVLQEPEKLWLHNEDNTKLLQFGQDRMVYNWRLNQNQPSIYPKYENIKKDFFKYWDILSNYIKQYPSRKIEIKMYELYYSNILPIGDKHFLKNDADLHKALNFVSPYPENYQTVIPHINLQIPVDQSNLFLKLEKIRNNKDKSEAFLLTFSMRHHKKRVDNIDTDWYDKANQHIRQFFEKMTTENIKNYWKEEIICF